MANNDTGGNTKPTKLYRLLSGSITRYEGPEPKDGTPATRKVVTYEANGDAAGNQVWLTEKEAAAVGSNKLEEVHGATRNDQNGKIAAPPAVTSLTGAPAGRPVEDEGDAEVNDGSMAATDNSNAGGDSAGAVNVGETMATSGSGSTNPAVERVLAKKAATTK